MKVNLFTQDLDSLFKLNGEELQSELRNYEHMFWDSQSQRAGTLLAFFYLIGNYDNPEDTKNWTKSL